MNGIKKLIILFFLLVLSALFVPAQSNTTPIVSASSPQWLKDLRRWEIVAFGSIPFTMFTTTFMVDVYRWSQANGLDFSDEGRRYAPWPLKSAGAVAMDGKEVETTLLIAGCLSIAVAVTDLIIVHVKRDRARKRAEALPSGTIIITNTPLPEDSSGDDGESQDGEPLPQALQ